MTTLVLFQPSVTAPFQFQAEFDGQQYTVTVTWNIFGQRYYVNIIASNNVLVLAIPMIGSPAPLLLAAPTVVPLALSSLAWAGGIVSAVTSLPHGFTIGGVISLTIASTVPVGYSGVYLCIVTGTSTFTYPLPTNPGANTSPGTYTLTESAAAVVWNAGTVLATTASRLLYPIGSVINLTIAGVLPDGFNGYFPCVPLGPNSFAYAVANNPGPPPSVSGTYSPDISMTAGVFNSTLIWRPASGNFEINP